MIVSAKDQHKYLAGVDFKKKKRDDSKPLAPVLASRAEEERAVQVPVAEEQSMKQFQDEQAEMEMS